MSILKNYLNKSAPSMEAIDYQRDGYANVLAGIFADYKEGKIDRKTFEENISTSIAKRFNIKVKFKVDPTNVPNACMYPPILDMNHILAQQTNKIMQGLWQSTIYQVTGPIMRKIAKGELPSTGMLNYKTAKVSGLFSELPTESYFNQGLIDIASPAACAGVLLHEIGHYWTFLEFLGLYCYRNAVISNSINEYLSVKSKEEKFQICLSENKVWNLGVDPKSLAELKDEDAIKVLAGAYLKVYQQDKEYTQYDRNTSEVIADQFAIRMGADANEMSTTLGVMSGQKSRASFTSYYYYKNALMLGCVAAISGILTALLPPLVPFLTMLTTFFSYYSLSNLLVGIIGTAGTYNGWVYDNPRDRFKRMYNEMIGSLKAPGLPAEYVKNQLISLDKLKVYVNNYEQEKSISITFMKWLSSDYRKQESKKLEQQLMEEFMNNELYVTAAKLKHLQ